MSSWLTPFGALLTIVLWEVVDQMGEHDLLLQKVFLVQEQNDGGVLEPGVCDYSSKQSFTLLHPVLHRGGVKVGVVKVGQKQGEMERRERESLIKAQCSNSLRRDCNKCFSAQKREEKDGHVG